MKELFVSQGAKISSINISCCVQFFAHKEMKTIKSPSLANYIPSYPNPEVGYRKYHRLIGKMIGKVNSLLGKGRQ